MEAFALHHVPTVALLGLFGRDEIERHESKQSVTVQSSLEARKALLNALQAHGNISLYDSANQKKKFTVMNLEKVNRGLRGKPLDKLTLTNKQYLDSCVY